MSVVWSDTVDKQARGESGPACVVETMTAALDAQRPGRESFEDRRKRLAVGCSGLLCSLTVEGLIPVLVFPGSGRIAFGCWEQAEFVQVLGRLTQYFAGYGTLPVMTGREGRYSRTARWNLPGDLTVELTETDKE